MVRCVLLAVASILWSVPALAGPEVVRVRVPAKDVSRYFPPGTGLRVLSPAEFEAKVEAARRQPDDPGAKTAPRLIRARHRARWDSGLLRGRTELVVGAGPSGPVEFPLEPWTPAVLIEAGAAPPLGARDSGVAVLRIASSPQEQTLAIDWEQQPRPDSRGHGFSLGLPAVDTTILELELPRGWTASGPRGVRRGQAPAPDPSRVVWEIGGDSGRFDLELRDPADRGGAMAGSGAWMSTSTEVDLRRQAGPAGSMINWTADLHLELNPRHSGGLEARLDRGLELIDVRGDAVQGYRTARDGDETRVAVSLAEGARTTTVRLLAHAAVPSEGAWAIPAVRPLDAVWTGGRTVVILDDLHAVREYREHAGRLVPAGRSDAATAGRLVFEAESPRSVADLVFVRPRADLSCTVHGRLDLAAAPARLDCRLDWSLHRGSVAQLEVDLSPSWSPDRVEILGLDDPLAWHASRLPSEVTRLRVVLPASVLAAGRWTLAIGATSHSASARGPLDLPRVRPVDASIVDEAWSAWGDDGTTIQLVRARGLAWIDPAEVPGLATSPPSPGLRQVLAWRWTPGADGACDAMIDRRRIERHPRASIRTRARLSPDGRRLAVEGTLLVRSGGAPMGVLPIRVDGPGDPLTSWRFRGEDGGELPLRPLAEADRARFDPAGDGSMRGLAVDLPPHGQRSVSFRADRPWTSPGPIPLLYVPRDVLERAVVRVETPAGLKARVHGQGLGRLHPSLTDPDPGEIPPESDDRPGAATAHDLVVHAFSYADPGARLDLGAEPMATSPMPGVVRDALLTTSWDGRGRVLHHLRLLVQPGRSETFAFELPDGAVLVRALVDGAEVTPTRSGARLTMPAPSAGAGSRSGLVVLHYLLEDRRLGDGSILRPDRPRLELPCLSFTWEVSTPPGWRVLDPGPGLDAGEPGDPAAWPCRALGLSTPAWPWPAGDGRTDLDAGLAELDGRLGQPAADELTFAEWFTRWDRGPRPILVDRLALGAAGLGPRSSCSPGRLPADRRDSARALLQQHGLAAVSFPDALILTTESERARFARRAAWPSAITEALAWGADRADRLQTVSHWRGEAAPRASSASIPSAAGQRRSPGRRTWWFTSPGWPGSEARVYLVDGRRRMLSGWMVAGGLALAWLTTSGRVGGRRLALPAMAVAACLLLERILPARYAALPAGGLLGSLAILVAGLARRRRRVPAPSPPPRVESTVVRAATASASLLVLGLAVGAPGAAMPGADPPIVALFPYEGTFDPSRPPDRVILRLEDLRRLEHESADAEGPRAAIAAVSSGHRVSRKAGREILVETEIELAARGPGPFVWRVPVSSAREISATLGGEPVPIAVEPGGECARVVIPRAGNYLLSLRRWASARTEESGDEVLTLPVNPTPSARLIVAPPADGVHQGFALTRGRVETGPDRSLDARLGPSDRIVVRWAKAGREPARRESGPVDGLILWDVTPAGDRVRQRLTYHRTDEIASVRLAHDPGVILRSAHAPGRTRVYCEEGREKDQWLLTFDPPLPPTATLSLDAWHPLPGPADGDAANGRGGRADVQVRRLPGIRPAAAERFTGMLGVRRPGDWTGRLTPIRDTEPVDDEAFVKAWGALPAEPLTLCGTSRFGRELDVGLRTGIAPARIVVRPSVELRIESGRVLVAADAEVEAALPASIAVAQLPREMHLARVIGDGLIDWSVSPDHRLHLIWERKESRPRRRVRIVGWIPLGEDPLAAGTRPHRLRTPWIGWPGAESTTGSLTVYSPVEVAVQGGAGLSRLPTAAVPVPPRDRAAAVAAGTIADAPAARDEPRGAYLVVDPADLGELSWDARPSLVSVFVENQLTIDPDFAHWVAVIRYDVLGGALERINLRIPAAWAARARLTSSGEGRRAPPPQIIGPSAFWSIAPDRPLWGSHRLVLRSSVPIGANREVLYPEVAPLGKGAVADYLAVVNATGHPLVAEDATGLQPVPRAPRFRDDAFEGVAGVPGGVYRVIKDAWALRIQAAGAGPGSSVGGDDAADVVAADVTLAVRPDRSWLGRALYEIRPDGGRLLNVELPAGSTMLWAAVEPEPVVPLRDGPSTWSIPLGPAPSRRVCLIWSTPPTEAVDPAAGRWSLPIPRAGREPARALVTVSTPDGSSIDGLPAGLEPATPARFDRARAEELGRTIRESIARIDRSSGRDHEHLASLLIDHQLALRDARRAADREGSSPGKEELARSIDAAGDAIARVVEAAGLAEDLNAALNYLGRPKEPGNRSVGGIPEPMVPCRIRATGRLSAMIGTIPGLDESPAGPALRLAGEAGSGREMMGTNRSILLAAALAVAVIAATSLNGRRAPLAAATSLALVLAGAALIGGPAWLASGLGLAALSYLRGDP